jgi:hypothetical protein
MLIKKNLISMKFQNDAYQKKSDNHRNSIGRTNPTQNAKSSLCVGQKKRRGWGRPVRGSIVFFALFFVLLLGKQKKNKTIKIQFG